MAHVFISYAHVDADFAEILQGKIEKAGYNVWIDENRLKAGEDWRQQIDEAIRNSFAIVCVMSPEAFDSKYVTYEWAFAIGLGIKCIPVMLRNTQLHPRLEAFQYLDFTNRQARPWEKLATELKEASNKWRNAANATSTINSNEIPIASAIETELSKDIKKLLHELTADDFHIRKAAMKLLVEVEHLELLTDKFVEILRDSEQDYDLRVLAAEALGNIRDPNTFFDLLMELNVPSGFKLLNAMVSTLGKMHDERAIPRLREILNHPSYTLEKYEIDKLWNLQESLIGALEEIGTNYALQVLSEWKASTIEDIEDEKVDNNELPSGIGDIPF